MSQAAADDGLAGRIEEALGWLRAAVRDHPPAALATSLGAEDMVLTDMVWREGLAVEVFTIDTGRLNPETYELHQRVRERYGLDIVTYFPEPGPVEAFVRRYGINGFYDSVEARKECCRVRKVEPLKRALAGKGSWITGLRRAQAVTRQGIAERAFDEATRLMKYNPLAAWSEDDVWAYIHACDVPYNALHDQGYPSIGCAPCTRAVTPGEDIRAGRWWWERPESKECGLHRGSR